MTTRCLQFDRLKPFVYRVAASGCHVPSGGHHVPLITSLTVVLFILSKGITSLIIFLANHVPDPRHVPLLSHPRPATRPLTIASPTRDTSPYYHIPDPRHVPLLSRPRPATRPLTITSPTRDTSPYWDLISSPATSRPSQARLLRTGLLRAEIQACATSRPSLPPTSRPSTHVISRPSTHVISRPSTPTGG